MPAVRYSLRTALAACALSMLPAAALAVPFNFAFDLGPEVAGATGTGSATVVLDPDVDSLFISAAWSGLSGTTTVAHIHCCTTVAGAGTIGVAVTPVTLPGFPVGVSAGSYSVTLNTSLDATYTGAFRTTFGGGTAAGAEAALLQGLRDGKAYLNIHSSTFGGGEIRDFATAVPEPPTLALMALAAGLLLLTRIRARGRGPRDAIPAEC